MRAGREKGRDNFFTNVDRVDLSFNRLNWLERNVQCTSTYTCFYYVTNFLVQNKCMFLKFFSFTFMKIEQNYLLVLIHLNSADLRGNSRRLYFTKTTLQKMRKTAMVRCDTKKTNQIKITPPWNFVAMLQKVYFHRSILSWVPVLPRLNSPRVSQHHINFTLLDHRSPLFFKTWIIYSS